ncbi:uncharacterized protein JCM6883_004918 [Sporobolomyces salmoneus]|uniref:uncharacterized protein n=1 Tax=Sporobolomyces salmoneus TaxID=183962 RepID=UPI0031816F99
MEDLVVPAANDPDSSLPSLFPYDSFPIPRGLYTKSNSSQSSVGRYNLEQKEEEEESGTPRGKILVGQVLQNTLRRPSGGRTGLAPALPVSPPRSGSTRSSPSTSPTRTRRVDTARLRNLAQKNRIRDFRNDEDDLPSQKASRSTIASFTSTESVYEDAVEPESDVAEEVILDMEETQTRILPPLDMEILPDTPPELEVPDRDPRSRQITPKPNHQQTAQISPSFLASPVTLSPDLTASSLDERALYEQRQAALQAELQVQRRASSRLSISSLPTSPRSTPYRRHSGILPLSPGSASHHRRLSLASATSPPIAGARHFYPKPLVLTPARTMSTPLTSEPVHHASSPSRHLSTHEGSLDGHLRTHSRGSSCYDGTIRTASPLSPGGYSAESRSNSPWQSSPKRQSSLGANPRRRSLGYVDSSANDSLSTFGRRAVGYGRRGRSASEDTGATRTTIDSALTRFTADDETPESSLGGWSDERKPSPLLDDKEWENQWQKNGSSAGTPLESVAEVSSGNLVVAEDDMEEEGESRSPRLHSPAPIVRRRAATDDRRSTNSTSSSLLEASFAATARPSPIRRDSVPPTPPPKMPLPRPPPSSSRQSAPSPLPRKRTKQSSDEKWNGESFAQNDTTPSSSSVGDEDSDAPRSPKKPTSEAIPVSPRRPIVIKGTTSQSAAATARRSARLSATEPPHYPASVESDRYSLQSNDRIGGGNSRPSSRASRHTTGRSRETSQETRLVGGGGPLTTLPESDSYSDSEDFYSRFSTQGSRRFQAPPERSQSRASYASPRISIGSTFANGFGATRKLDFEPRNPRTREELDAGQGSYLEVLLYSDPPPRIKSNSARWSIATESTTSAKKGSIGTPLIRTDSPPTIAVPANKSKSNNNFAQKFFGGLRGKTASPTPNNDKTSRRRPMSMMAPNSTRSEQTKPRPIVSGPLELQQAELERKQRIPESTSTNPQNLSVTFAPPHIPIMKSYTSLARVYEEDASRSSLNRSASLETIDRPVPRRVSLPPGLVTSASRDSLQAPPPPPPMKPARSPLRPSPNSGNELLLRPRANSPVQSFKSFQSSQQSETAKSRASLSEPIGVRDVLRGQFLER